MNTDIKNYFYESANLKKDFICNNVDNLKKVISLLAQCLRNKNKILIAWNWWSAADSQHFAAELIWRYKMEREPLSAIALTTDTSIITSIWNDYWYDEIFSRQIEWLWNKWDIFFIITTSGNSRNLILAVESAKRKWITTIWLTWNWWWKIGKILDFNLVVESSNTPRIQETHLCIYHVICEELENILFRKQNNEKDSSYLRYNSW